MKVILLEDIKGLGKKFDAKEVNGGYARNFLLPKKLVKVATPEAMRELSAMKSRFEKEEALMAEQLKVAAFTISKRTLKFPLRADESGTLFGSVTKEMILKGIRDAGFVTKERVDVKLDHPLKEAGEYEVEVDLKKGIRAKLKVIVERLQE